MGTVFLRLLFLLPGLDFRGRTAELLRRDIPLLQPTVGELPEQGVQHGGQRNHQQHSPNAQQLAADAHRHQHPHSRQTHGGTHHSGVNEVALDLLQYKEHHHKGQCLHRILHQNEEGSHNAAHKGTHHRHQCRHRDDDTDQRDIGHPEQRHGNGKQATQNTGLQTLPGDEAGKGGVGEPENPQNLVRGFFRQKGIQNLFPLTGQDVLPCQTVQAEHNADHHIHQRTGHIADDADSAAHDRRSRVTRHLHGIL